MLQRVGLPASTFDRLPAGVLRRAATAHRHRPGARSSSPRLIVCDEAISALDLSTQAQVLNLLVDLQEELGVAYLFIAHDLTVVRHVSDRVVVLYRGQIMESGSADAVCRSPLSPVLGRIVVGIAGAPDPVAQRRPPRGPRIDTVRVATSASGGRPLDACPLRPAVPSRRRRVQHDATP